MKRWLIILKLVDGSGYRTGLYDASLAEDACKEALMEARDDLEPSSVHKIYRFDDEEGNLIRWFSQLEGV